jgi:ABC-type branched-subunit amino acid transport system permease subunit
MKRMTLKHRAKRGAMRGAVMLASFYLWHLVILGGWSGNYPAIIGMFVSLVIAVAVTEAILPRDAD